MNKNKDLRPLVVAMLLFPSVMLLRDSWMVALGFFVGTLGFYKISLVGRELSTKYRYFKEVFCAFNLLTLVLVFILKFYPTMEMLVMVGWTVFATVAVIVSVSEGAKCQDQTSD